eukprot:TRINITY_DN9790_c0_g2_i1.p1 TRINITY_DN9790_c0_g2~~TRINITY_DN9790_c0_g2_i1.p1  ORF type:complete len:122 (+),score=0.28 TRINITY_DN9790_c0_g2_i1:132-497(+)
MPDASYLYDEIKCASEQQDAEEKIYNKTDHVLTKKRASYHMVKEINVELEYREQSYRVEFMNTISPLVKSAGDPSHKSYNSSLSSTRNEGAYCLPKKKPAPRCRIRIYVIYFLILFLDSVS